MTREHEERSGAAALLCAEDILKKEIPACGRGHIATEPPVCKTVNNLKNLVGCTSLGTDVNLDLHMCPHGADCGIYGSW